MLNKTRANSGEKIASVPNSDYTTLLRRVLIGASGLMLAVILLEGWLALAPSRLEINGRHYNLLLATTPAQLQKGLGGRTDLPENSAMLFVFKGEAIRCFWMKDMRFPIDMIWLNFTKQVVALKTDISPATFPESFCPPQLASYVVELNAGQVRLTNVRPGQRLSF